MRPPRPSAPLLAAAVAAGSLAAPSAHAQFFGLRADGPAAPAPPATAPANAGGGWFGLRPDGPPTTPAARPAQAAPAAPASGVKPAGGWLGLRADGPNEPAADPAAAAVPAVRPVSHVAPHPAAAPHAPQPQFAPQPGYVAHPPVADPATGAAFGLVADGPVGGYPVHAAAPAGPEPVYAPGTRQVAKKGHLWPPFPRPTGPKASVATQFHHAHYWPLPYTCRDRAYVRGLAAMQVAAGRAGHAAVHGFHFDPATHALTDAGREHLRVAVRAAHFGGSAPIAVAAADTPEASEARANAVRVAVAELGAPHLGGNVVLSTTPVQGRPALEIDRIRATEIVTMPQPRIPVNVGAGGGGAGVGAGAGL